MGLPPIQHVLNKFHFPRPSNTVRQLLASKPSGRFRVNGWIHRKPKQLSKNLTFAQLRDVEGNIIQLVDKQSPSRLKVLRPDSTVSIDGLLVPNSLGERSEIEVIEVQVLNQANVVPSQLNQNTRDWPPAYRYLQLRQPKYQHLIRKRAAVLRTCRKVLEAHSFTEIETPVLFKSTPEGAREFLVPTRKAGYMYALPQSPQQYKQLLIASGFDKYYQIAKCFRDEDLRQDRQPEFTQLDIEMAFATAQDVQEVVEDVVRAVWSGHTDQELVTFRNNGLIKSDKMFGFLTYSEAISKFGIDKPDLRYELEIQTLPAKATINPDFQVLEALVLRSGSTVLTQDSIKQITDKRNYKMRMPNIVEIHSDKDIVSAIAPFANMEDWNTLLLQLNARPGDIIAVSDRRAANYENPTPLGRLRQILIGCQPEVYRREDDRASVAIWVHNFPLFEPECIEEDAYPVYNFKRLSSFHHPFTMVNLNDYEKLISDPLSCHGYHFDLVINGVEVGGGSTRVHDAELQKYILTNVLKIPKSQETFGHLLNALATGCPPHAGLAIGLDRMVAMVCSVSSIRDVIAFPKSITGADPVVGSPSEVTNDQLRNYHIIMA